MAVQGGYAINHNALYAGMATSIQLCNTVSKFNGTGATIAYGLGVVSDGDDGMKLPEPSSTSRNFIGVVKYELNRAYQDGDVMGAPARFDATVITRGEIAVMPAVDVSRDDPVYLIVGDGDKKGMFSNTAGSGATAAVQITGAKWTATTTTASAQPGKISLGIGG